MTAIKRDKKLRYESRPYALQEWKARAAKDHGKKFQSELAAFFSGTVFAGCRKEIAIL